MEIFLVPTLLLVIAQLIGTGIAKRRENKAVVAIVAPPLIFALLISVFSWIFLFPSGHTSDRQFKMVMGMIVYAVLLIVGSVASLVIAAVIYKFQHRAN